MERVSHTITLEDKVGLLELQREYWQYFVENILAITEDPAFNIDNEADLERELNRQCFGKCKNMSEFLHEHL